MVEETLYCANHPNRETSLRCNRCEKPICTQCAVLTPVGYRCKECVRGQQKVFDTARSGDFLIAFLLTGISVAIAVGLLGYIGFWGFFLAPAIGGGLAEIVRRAVRRRRSRRLALVAVVGGVLGILPYFSGPILAIVSMLGFGASLSGLPWIGLSALYPVAYGVLILSTFYYRFNGLSLG